jgi:hypothetical protein
MTLTNGGSFTDKVNFIWSVADLLRGTYKQSEYGSVTTTVNRTCSRPGCMKAALTPGQLFLVALGRCCHPENLDDLRPELTGRGALALL